jgi:hypothetical protein
MGPPPTELGAFVPLRLAKWQGIYDFFTTSELEEHIQSILD